MQSLKDCNTQSARSASSFSLLLTQAHSTECVGKRPMRRSTESNHVSLGSGVIALMEDHMASSRREDSRHLAKRMLYQDDLVAQVSQSLCNPLIPYNKSSCAQALLILGGAKPPNGG